MSESNMKERKGEHPFGDAGQLIFLVFFLIVWVGDSFVLHLSTFLSMYLPLSLRLIFSGITLLVSVYLFRSGHVVVTHAQRPGSVIHTGVFRYVRHPLYSATILLYIALTVSTSSLLCLGLLAIIFLFYNFIAGYEEKLMEAKFTEEYGNYKRLTGKWIPRIGKGKEKSF